VDASQPVGEGDSNPPIALGALVAVLAALGGAGAGWVIGRRKSA
jgi:hypothetical protein